MNAFRHQPFEDWILSSEPLNETQRASLHEHLRTCESCQRRQLAWNGVRHLMQTAGEVSPAPGFANRWHLALEVRQVAQARQQRLAWGLFTLSLVLAAFALLGLFWQFFGAFQAPQWVIVAVLMAWTEINVISRMVSEFIQEIPLVLAPFVLIGMMLFAGFTSMVSVLWVVVYRKLIVRRVNI